MEVAGQATSTVTAPDDNILTYEGSSTGSFLINSYDLPALGFQDTKFVWAFISFDDPISPFVLPGDFNDDGVVDDGDYAVWRAQFGLAGQSLSADGNQDGVVDNDDYVILSDNLAEHLDGTSVGFEQGDIDFDGDVDLDDFGQFKDLFPGALGQSQAIPEPASLTLAMGALVALALCWRQK